MRILKYLLQHKAALAAVFALLLVQAFCDLSLPRYTASIVDNVVHMAAVGGGGDSAAELIHLGSMMLLFATGMLVTNIVISVVASRTGAKIARDLRERFFAKVLSFSAAEVDSFSAASLITRGTNDIQQIQFVTMMLQRVVLYAPILAVGGIFMVMQTNASMAWVVALAVVVVFVVVAALMSLTMPRFKVMQQLVDKLNQVSREILTGLPVIRAFGREAHEQERFAQANAKLMKTQLFTNRAMVMMMPLLMLAMNLVSVAIVWVGGHYVEAGTMQTGDLIAFITYAMLIIMSFLMIGMVATALPRANVAAQRIDEVLSVTPCIDDPRDARDGELAAVGQGVAVEFDDVSFRYNEGSDNVLEHISFAAEAGETTAIIGSTGCGKSTIIKLIERFYDVSEGAIKINGVDIREISQAKLRSLLGYSPQQAYLFGVTVKSTVAFADESMPVERLQRAIDVAQAREFVEATEDGLETAISQGGTNVSGGQRQRLSIARALATDASVYLFDDSFSALDYKTDAQLRAGLAQQMAGKTLLIVAQRIATIMHADKIIVLDEGRIVGSGTHDELLESCEEYRQIALSQLSKEELEKGGAR